MNESEMRIVQNRERLVSGLYEVFGRPRIQTNRQCSKYSDCTYNHFVNSDEECVEHYGIKGQRWGLRRFQNEDRTLTEAGKSRYGRQKEKDNNKPKSESKTWKSKEAGYLTDDELNKRNSRLQREKQYRDMTKSRGRKFLEGLGKATNKILVASLIGAASGFMAKHYKDIIDAGEAFIQNAEWLQIDLANLR